MNDVRKRRSMTQTSYSYLISEERNGSARGKVETLECKVAHTSGISREVLPHVIPALQKNDVGRSTEGDIVEAVSMSTGYPKGALLSEAPFGVSGP